MLKFEVYTDKNISQPKFFYLADQISRCLQRETLLEWFTVTSRKILQCDLLGEKVDILYVTGHIAEIAVLVKEATVFLTKDKVEAKSEFPEVEPQSSYEIFGVVPIPNNPEHCVLMRLGTSGMQPPFSWYDQFTVGPGMIANYEEDRKPENTDVGKFLWNYILFVDPFNTLIPYRNTVFKIGEIDDQVAKLILDGKAGRPEYNKYMNNGAWLGCDGTITTPTFSEKSLTSDPNMKKRKKELFEKYHNAKDPLVIAQIEKELIELDKNWIRGDVSEAYYFGAGSKAFNEARRKMYIGFGLTSTFDKNSSDFMYTDNSLAEGWEYEDLDKAINQVRKGVYNRSRETAKGGEQTKLLLRTFQDTRIVMDDCGSKQGQEFTLSEANYDSVIGMHLLNGEILTEENKSKYLGKTVKLRFPTYCKAEGGFCYVCMGERLRKLRAKVVGHLGITATSSMQAAAMKSFHVSGVSLYEITDIGRFLRTSDQ